MDLATAVSSNFRLIPLSRSWHLLPAPAPGKSESAGLESEGLEKYQTSEQFQRDCEASARSGRYFSSLPLSQLVFQDEEDELAEMARKDEDGKSTY